MTSVLSIEAPHDKAISKISGVEMALNLAMDHKEFVNSELLSILLGEISSVKNFNNTGIRYNYNVRKGEQGAEVLRYCSISTDQIWSTADAPNLNIEAHTQKMKSPGQLACDLSMHHEDDECQVDFAMRNDKEEEEKYARRGVDDNMAIDKDVVAQDVSGMILQAARSKDTGNNNNVGGRGTPYKSDDDEGDDFEDEEDGDDGNDYNKRAGGGGADGGDNNEDGDEDEEDDAYVPEEVDEEGDEDDRNEETPRNPETGGDSANPRININVNTLGSDDNDGPSDEGVEDDDDHEAEDDSDNNSEDEPEPPKKRMKKLG